MENILRIAARKSAVGGYVYLWSREMGKHALSGNERADPMAGCHRQSAKGKSNGRFGGHDARTVYGAV